VPWRGRADGKGKTKIVDADEGVMTNRTAEEMHVIEDLKRTYGEIEGDIRRRLEDFKQVWRGSSEEEIFEELAFCIFTPQSRARSCWAAVRGLVEKGMLFEGDAECIAGEIKMVRFRNNKARHLVAAREMFTAGGGISIRPVLMRFDSSRGIREWLVEEVKGYGCKEASHFLRNIGLGEDLAILDRHILKNLAAAGAIPGVPGSISRKKYLELEELMRDFAAAIDIPMAHLDLLLWYRETGEIFK